MAGDGAHRLIPDPHPTGAGARYCLTINSPVKSLFSQKLGLDKELMSCVGYQHMCIAYMLHYLRLVRHLKKYVCCCWCDEIR